MYINLQRNICFLFSETSPHCTLNISSSLYLLRNCQYHGQNFRRTLDAPNYTGAKERFYNSNFRVLLIMQFHKVLTTLPPWKIIQLGYELSVKQNLLTRDILSSKKVTNTKQTWIVESFEQYFKLFVASQFGTLFHHEYSTNKSKRTKGYSIRFDYFPLQISGNSG
jgi:hypothetical protein